MKIAMIGPKRIPSREGGIEIVVAELSKRMAAQGHDVTAYNRKSEHIAGKDFEQSEKIKQWQGCRSAETAVFDIDRNGDLRVVLRCERQKGQAAAAGVFSLQSV